MRTAHRNPRAPGCGRYPDLAALANHYLSEIRRIYPYGAVRQTEAARDFAGRPSSKAGANPWFPPDIQEVPQLRPGF